MTPEAASVLNLTIDQLARDYAWQLGHDDYPATDRCIYSSAKSFDLYTAYWGGWDVAAKTVWGNFAPRHKRHPQIGRNNNQR